MVLGELFLEALSSGVITQPEIDTQSSGVNRWANTHIARYSVAASTFVDCDWRK
jgi:hypothetical protein